MRWIAAVLGIGACAAAPAAFGQTAPYPTPAPSMSIEEYEPKSTLVVAEHPRTRSKFPFIDIHNHQSRDMSAEKAAALVADMDRINMGVLVNLSGRGDKDMLRGVRSTVGNMDRVLWPGTLDALFGVFLEETTWEQQKDILVGTLAHDTPNLRRRVFVAQLACEAAAFAGDVETLVYLLEHATANGLFDRHWLEKCVLLQPYLDVPAVAAVPRCGSVVGGALRAPARSGSTPSGTATGCTTRVGLPSPTRSLLSTATKLVKRVTR